MSININFSSSNDEQFILIQLFQEALRKVGKNKAIESLKYSCDEGLIAQDSNGVFWKIDVNASLVLPDELKNSHVPDNEASSFCVECLVGIEEEDKGLCELCKYIKRA